MLLFYVLYILYCISLYFCLMWRINFIIVIWCCLSVTVYWAVLSMESHEESDSAPSVKKRDYQRTNFTDIAAYLSLPQFPAHIGTDKSKTANFRRACKKFTLQDVKLMTQWKQHLVTCVSSVNERRRLLAAYH